ncbi:MAG: hemolysin family protein [Clostridia bacterium]|nr:hemolysin family protein [Clostridia bacterium]
MICIIFSAYFSAAETAFSAINKIRLKSEIKTESKRGKRLLNIYENKYDKVLSTVLIGNNIVNITAAGVGTVLFVRNYGEIGTTLSTLVLTIIVLIFGEITPKSFAKENPEKFAEFVLPGLEFFMIIFSPLNIIFNYWKKFLDKIFAFNKKKTITEGEFLTMVDEATSEGGITISDNQLIYNVMEFNDKEAQEILIPRVDMVAIEKESSLEEYIAIFNEYEFSRIPVYSKSIDNIIGYVHQKDLFNKVIKGNGRVQDIIKPLIFVIPTMKISLLLKSLQRRHLHIAVVTDEFGGTMGLITMEDILEELVGEIYDEHDDIEFEYVKLAPNTYKITCSMTFEDLTKLLNIEDDEDIGTVGAFVQKNLDKIAEKGDSFYHQGHKFTVNKVEGRRVTEIIAEKDNSIVEDTN